MRAEEILRKRRDRAIAIILTVKEHEVDPILDGAPDGKDASVALRKAVLDQVNDFYNMALDVASSGEAPKFEFNPAVWVPRIEGELAAIRRAVEPRSGP